MEDLRSALDHALPLIEMAPAAPPASQRAGTFDEPAVIERTDEYRAIAAEERPEGEVDTVRTSRESLLARLLRFGKRTAPVQAEAAATAVEGNPAFLFSKFRAFYNEVIRARHQRSEFTAGFSTAILTDHASDASPPAAAATLSKRLLEVLELQAAEAKWMGGEAGARYADAQYAMAALADETFSEAEWDGQPEWRQHLLEVQLFKTHAADVELFKRIDKLLKEQPETPVARDLGRVYLLVLAAGFRGKYRQFGLTRPLAEYRQRLYEYVHRGDALLLYAADRRIFPDSVAHTLAGRAVSRFTAVQRWTAVLVVVFVAYAVVAHLAWNRVSEDLEDVTGRIHSTSSTGAR